MTVNDDVSNKGYGENSVEQAAPESNACTQNHTPAPKRAANESGDMELGASKPQQSETGTPNVRTMLVGDETVIRSSQNTVPLMHTMNDNYLARWEAVCERLAVASTVAAKGAAVTQTVIESNEQTEASKIAQVSTNDLCDLCDELIRRLQTALKHSSEQEKRQKAQDRGAQAITML